MQRMKERSETFEKTMNSILESSGSEALKEYLEERDREDKQLLRNITAQEDRLLKAAHEVEMVEVEASIEATKLRFDAVKQQATFSVVGIAGVTTITESILPEKLRLVALFWTTIGLLLTTIVLSLLLLYLLSIGIEYMLERGRKVSEVSRLDTTIDTLYLSALGFPLAVITFLVFTIWNVV